MSTRWGEEAPLSEGDPSPSEQQYWFYASQLIAYGQEWHGSDHINLVTLNHKIQALSHGHLRLCSSAEAPTKKTPQDAWHRLTISHEAQIYGTLEVALVPLDPCFPLVSVAVAQRLAPLCGWLLRIQQENRLIRQYRLTHAAHSIALLTPRQRELLLCLIHNMKVCEMAAQLHIALSTVMRHLANLYVRLDVHSYSEAKQVGIAAGLQ